MTDALDRPMDSDAQGAMRLSLTVNGVAHRLAVAPGKRLTRVLREDLGLTGTKVGCDAGDCEQKWIHLSNRYLKLCVEADPKLEYVHLFGEANAIFIFGAPDTTAAMSMLLTLSRSGAVISHKTTALLSNDDAMEAMNIAGSKDTGYRTPREEWRGWEDHGGEG